MYGGGEQSSGATFLPAQWNVPDAPLPIPNNPSKIQSAAGYIQTISGSDIINKLESANSLWINGDVYQLDGKSNYVGLGNDRYIICTWKKIHAI